MGRCVAWESGGVLTTILDPTVVAAGAGLNLSGVEGRGENVTHTTRLCWGALLAGIWIAAGCSRLGFGDKDTRTEEWPLRVSADIPAAQGKVKVKHKPDGNREIHVQVEHMAPPERTAKDAAAYVVWLRAGDRNAKPRNIGILRVNEDLKGELRAITPFPEFDVFVTAEKSPQVSEPSEQPLMTVSIRPSTRATF